MLGFDSILTCLLIFFCLFLEDFWRHLNNVIISCFVGFECLYFDNFKVKIRENEYLFFLKMAELFRNNQILMW